MRSKAHSTVEIDNSAYVLKIELDSSAFAIIIEVVLLGQRVQIENQVILSFLVVVLGHVTCIVNFCKKWIFFKEITKLPMCRSFKINVWTKSFFNFSCSKLDKKLRLVF